MPVVMLLIIAVLLIVAGAGSLLIGTDSVVPDRPVAAAIGGTVALVGGFIVLALALVVREIALLRAAVARPGGLFASQLSQDMATQAPSARASEVLAPAVSEPQNGAAGTAPSSSGLGTAVAGAGALAAVAAAVGAAAAQDEKQGAQPDDKGGNTPDKGIDLFEQALNRVTAEAKAKATAEPEILEEARAPVPEAALSPHKGDLARSDTDETLTLPEVGSPSTQLSSAFDDKPGRKKDEFDLEAEFDRMLDETRALSATAPDESGTSVLGGPLQDAPDIRDAEEIAGEDLALSDLDKHQLETLVRSAIEDVKEREAVEIEPVTPDAVELSVPDIQTLREKIAPPVIEEADETIDLEVTPAAIERDVPEMAAVEAGGDDGRHDRQHDQETTPEPEVAAATISPPAAAIEKAIVRTFSSGPNQYTMYSDGSISADTPTGRFEFSSFNDLREFIDSHKA